MRWVERLWYALGGLLLGVALAGLLAVVFRAPLQAATWRTGPQPSCTPLTEREVVNKTGTEYSADWQCVQIPAPEQTRIAIPPSTPLAVPTRSSVGE